MNNDDPDLKTLRENAASLPRQIPPARDLWPEIRAQLPASVSPRHAWTPRLALAAAAVVLIASGIVFFSRPEAPGWVVTSLSGTPRIGAKNLSGDGTWRRGQWLETDALARARFAVGTIGEVHLEPNSRLRLLGTSSMDHRLELARGTLHALIWAPPRLFFVETPSATAIDLGCAYALTVDDHGAGLLHVTSGYVALEHDGREALIPAGMMCATRPGTGPGTPFSETTAQALRDALQRFDSARDAQTALDEVLAHSGPGDEVTLWHLLTRASAGQRPAVFEKLAALRPPPAGVTREGILAGEKSMLVRWAIELGLAPAFPTG
jgi:hypothetical protein